MTQLEDVVNIGPVLAGELRQAGIPDLDVLREMGAEEAWVRVRGVNPERDCANSLLALHGAIRGVRWMSMDARERERIADYARRHREVGGGSAPQN